MHYDLESERGSPGCRSRTSAHGRSQVGAGDRGLRADRVPARDPAGARRRRSAPTSPSSRPSGSPVQAVDAGRDRRARPGRRHSTAWRSGRTSRSPATPTRRGPRPGSSTPPGGSGPGSSRAAGCARSRSTATRSVGVDTDRGRLAAPVVADRGRRLGRGPRPDRGRRAAGPGLAPRDGVLRPAGRPRSGLPDRHRRGQRGLLPARGRRPDARRAGGPQRGRRLAGPAARHRGRPPPSRTWSGGSARASPG